MTTHRQRVPPLDVAWLFVESPATPMHVGCLQIFSPPSGAGDEFREQLLARLRDSSAFAPPFSLEVDRSGLGRLMPSWVESDAIDLEHHLRGWALPAPGGERELGELTSHLVGLPLDTTRPLWECHVIEGLADGRYAMLTKIHHSLMDGIGGMRLLQATLSPDAGRTDLPPPWAPHPESGQPEHLPDHHLSLEQVMRGLSAQFDSLPALLRAMRGLLAAGLRRRPQGLVAPYTAPPSILNARISRERRFATCRLSLARIKALARRSKTTVNDVVLAVLSGALRRYLGDLDALPARPLVVGIPVSVRPEGDNSVGTAVSFALASMATDLAAPRARLDAIHASTQAAKAQLQGLGEPALTEYTLLTMAPFIAELISGLAGRVRPVFNLVVSNVPGPAQPLYYNGARLDEMYPISIATHGQALNITLMSYDNTLHLGFTACNQSVPQVQRLAAHSAQALGELERACGIRPVRSAA